MALQYSMKYCLYPVPVRASIMRGLSNYSPVICKLNSKTVSVVPSINPSLIFPFHLLLSPVHTAGFSYCFFPGFLVIFILLIWKNNNKLHEHWINSQDPASPQANSSFLEIDHFRETSTAVVCQEGEGEGSNSPKVRGEYMNKTFRII